MPIASLWLPVLSRGRSPTPPAVLPYDLHDAIYARLKAELDPAVKVYAGFGGPGASMPYVEIYDITETQSFMTGSPYLFDGELQVNVYATGRLAARQLGDAVAVSLEDAPLPNQSSIVIMVRPMRRFAATDDAPGIGGKTIYQEIRTFSFMAQNPNS